MDEIIDFFKRVFSPLLVLTSILWVFVIIAYGIAFGAEYHSEKQLERWNLIETSGDDEADQLAQMLKDTKYQTLDEGIPYRKSYDLGVLYRKQRLLGYYCAEVRHYDHNQKQVIETAPEKLLKGLRYIDPAFTKWNPNSKRLKPVGYTWHLGRTPIPWDILDYEGDENYPWWEYQCWKVQTPKVNTIPVRIEIVLKNQYQENKKLIQKLKTNIINVQKKIDNLVDTDNDYDKVLNILQKERDNYIELLKGVETDNTKIVTENTNIKFE